MQSRESGGLDRQAKIYLFFLREKSILLLNRCQRKTCPEVIPDAFRYFEGGQIIIFVRAGFDRSIGEGGLKEDITVLGEVSPGQTSVFSCGGHRKTLLCTGQRRYAISSNFSALLHMDCKVLESSHFQDRSSQATQFFLLVSWLQPTHSFVALRC